MNKTELPESGFPTVSQDCPGNTSMSPSTPSPGRDLLGGSRVLCVQKSKSLFLCPCLGHTQHLARQELPANFTLGLSMQAAELRGCEVSTLCQLRIRRGGQGVPQWGAGENRSPSLRDEARTNCSSWGICPGARQSPQGSHPAQMQQHPLSFTPGDSPGAGAPWMSVCCAEQASLCKLC